MNSVSRTQRQQLNSVTSISTNQKDQKNADSPFRLNNLVIPSVSGCDEEALSARLGTGSQSTQNMAKISGRITVKHSESEQRSLSSTNLPKKELQRTTQSCQVGASEQDKQKKR